MEHSTLSYVCERCGHRKWGQPLGGGAGLRACFDCTYGSDASRARPIPLGATATWTVSMATRRPAAGAGR